ncbi:MAG: HAD-IC family P-type ATPase [Patescibacteria group bacterium]
MSSSELTVLFGVDERGLSDAEAERRLSASGPNVLPEAKPEHGVAIFLRQFASPLIYLLIGAAGVVAALREYTDAGVILGVLLFNAIVGAFQEGRARRTLAALKRFTATDAAVLRDGKERIVPDAAVVPGDIILLHEGERVPADARVMASNTLAVDEAALTGESKPIHKVVEAPRLLADDDAAPVADQVTMVFKGTHVLAGSGRALVAATGKATVIGGITEAIAAIDTEIPLKVDVRNLSRLIVCAVLGISSLLFLLGAAFGKDIGEMFITVVALSVSIIPEGLPIVLTIVLASGVARMSRRNALVKRLQAVEALGQARVIALDKTGTITKNEMVIQRVVVDRGVYVVGGVGYEPDGGIAKLEENGVPHSVLPADDPALILAGRIAAFSANARLTFLEGEGQWKVHGDPTEAALAVFGAKVGFPKDDIERLHPLLDEIPFSYQTRYHATARRLDGQRFLSVVGAPEQVLELCHDALREGQAVPLGPADRAAHLEVFQRLAQEGLRVLAFSYAAEAPEAVGPETMPPLVFAGFYGMRDALRPEAAPAIRRAQEAGMRVTMITGDHRLSAEVVAREAGIFKAGDTVLTGGDMDTLSDEALDEALGRVAVFARVTPEHKLRIIRGYRRRGEIVAMTGDGVNDAPSLVAADLGIAMGKIGTEVAKEASDIVILDDNFDSVVAAIEEGRSVYKTIKKVILYLFSTSAGEVLTIGGGLALGYPLPILPAQIIWLNLVTDGFLDVALAMEPKEAGLLTGRFERPRKYLFDRLMVGRMAVMAIPMMIGTLVLFDRYFGADLAKAWTVSLTALAVFQWFNAWNCRSERRSIFRMNPFSNPSLVAATIVVVFLQLAAIYAPFLQRILHTVPLSLQDWLFILPIAASILVAEEARKFVFRRGKMRPRYNQDAPPLPR